MAIDKREQGSWATLNHRAEEKAPGERRTQDTRFKPGTLIEYRQEPSHTTGAMTAPVFHVVWFRVLPADTQMQ